MTDKELRALQRDIEAQHDRIDEPLTALQAKRHELLASIEPVRVQILALEEQIAELKKPIHALRLKQRDEVKAREAAKS